MDALADEMFRVGTVTGTHGLRGDLKVRPVTSGSAALLEAREVLLEHPAGAVVWRRTLRASEHKGLILLRLEGVDSIETAQPLVGSGVLMRREDLAELPEDENYWFELEGMSVVDLRRGGLGTLEDMFTTAAHDIYVVRGPFGEILIPAVDAFVVEIDRTLRRMTVDLPEGLVPETDAL